MEIFAAVLITASVAAFVIHCLTKQYIDTYWIGFKRGQAVAEEYARRNSNSDN